MIGFHPSKEDSKVTDLSKRNLREYCFHPSKEDSKASFCESRRQPSASVSIPLRKIQKLAESAAYVVEQ